MKLIAAILISFLILACSENKPALTQNEKNYLQTQDSLVKYKSDIEKLSDGDSLQPCVYDYITLDYEGYKSKYHFSEKEMDSTRKSLNTCFKLVKLFREIEENISNRNQHPSKKSGDSIKKTYSFDKKLKPANSAKEEDVEVEVLMKAFEKK